MDKGEIIKQTHWWNYVPNEISSPIRFFNIHSRRSGYCITDRNLPTVMPTKSDSDVIFCFHSLSKTLTCTVD